MSIKKDTIDFLNKIINEAKTEEELIKNLNTYKDYLVLTGIYSEDDINFINNLIEVSDKILCMKKQFDTFNVNGFIKDISQNKKPQKTNEENKVKTKHYTHYVYNNSSSNCGSSESSSSNCFSSSSSHCGSGSTSRYC